jgi:hypothetical protein
VHREVWVLDYLLGMAGHFPRFLIKILTGMVAHAYNPSYTGSIDKRIMVQGQSRQKEETLENSPKVKRAGVWLKW